MVSNDGPIVLTRRLRKEYFQVVAVNDVDLAIRRGEIFGLIGPNGAGKTTLLRMIATTLEPTSGHVLIDNADVWDHPTTVRGKMGFMPDFFLMYPKLTVRELLTYFGIAHGLAGDALAARVNEVIKLIDLVDKRDTPCKGLSRGMVQRLGLGRAILHKPELLLLDEPASGLDPLARQSLFDVLRAIRADGATIVISSHILTELSGLCTSVGIMHDGRFLETGTPAEITRKLMPKRQMALTVVSGVAEAVAIITADPQADDVHADDLRVRFAFDGVDADLAALTKALVTQGVGVALIEETETTLHELYLAIAERTPNASAQ